MSIRVMVADDNKSFSDCFCSYMGHYPDIKIVGTAENGFEVLQMVRDLKPDVLFLDIVMPAMDGLEVLRSISHSADYKPCICVISALSSPEIAQKAIKMGAHYFFIKPLDFEAILLKIRALFIDEKQSSKSVPPSSGHTKYFAKEEDVTALLLLSGIPPKIQGFRFLRDAISLHSKGCTSGAELYGSVAMRYNTTGVRVSKAINYALQVAWNRSCELKAPGPLPRIFGNKEKQPGNMQFIRAAAQKLRQGYP